GFARSEAGATITSFGTLEQTRQCSDFLTTTLTGIAQTALGEAWIEQSAVDAMCAELDRWAEGPDAFYAAVYCHAVGWVNEQSRASARARQRRMDTRTDIHD